MSSNRCNSVEFSFWDCPLDACVKGIIPKRKFHRIAFILKFHRIAFILKTSSAILQFMASKVAEAILLVIAPVSLRNQQTPASLRDMPLLPAMIRRLPRPQSAKRASRNHRTRPAYY